MFKKAKQVVISGGKLETFLGPNTSFEGHIKTDGNLRIEGSYEGEIEAVGNIIIGEKATVSATIKAHNVQVWGNVTGKVTASDRLEILRNGRVFADIEVKALLIDEGGLFRGASIVHGRHPEEEETPQMDTDEHR